MRSSPKCRCVDLTAYIEVKSTQRGMMPRSGPPFIARRSLAARGRWPALLRRRFERGLSLAQPPRRRHHFGDAQPELLVDDDDLAARDALAVHQEVHGLARQAVQAYDRARAEAQRLADGHAGAADLARQLDRDVFQ